MTDSEKMARIEKAVAQQDQRIQNAEKSAVAVETKTEQNEKNIDRVETQSIHRFEMLIDPFFQVTSIFPSWGRNPSIASRC